MPRKAKRKRKRVTGVRIRAEHNLEPDWDRFAWALLQHARLLIQKEAEQRKARP